jgi:hypothetical protein
MVPSYYDKWRYTLYTTFILLILFNKYTFQFTQSFFQKNGFSYNKNIIFMMFVTLFTLIIRYMMDYNI